MKRPTKRGGVTRMVNGRSCVHVFQTALGPMPVYSAEDFPVWRRKREPSKATRPSTEITPDAQGCTFACVIE